MIALLVGILDASASAAYLAVVPPPAWHAATLSLKGLLMFGWIIAARRTVISAALSANVGVLAAVALMSTISFLVSGAELRPFAQNLAFVAQLALTLQLIRHESLQHYARGVALTCAAFATLYLLMVWRGMIPNHYGRLLFFNGEHPNLGSEIFTMGVLCAGIFCNRREFVLVFGVAVASIFLMQGRAALLVCLAILALRLLGDAHGRLRSTRTGMIALVAVSGALLFEVASDFALSDRLGAVFLVDDVYRGVGTGGVGRTLRWELSWLYFTQSPFVGQGPDFFDRTGLPTAHNLFLYALVQFGLLSLPFFLLLALRFRGAFRVNPLIGAMLLSTLIMAVFNDRFLNLNPYPLVAYVLLLVIGTAPLPARQQAQPARRGLQLDTRQA